MDRMLTGFSARIDRRSLLLLGMSWLGSIATHGTLKLDATKLLGVPEATVEQALSQMLTSGSLLLEEIDGDPLIFLPHLRRAEEGIAAKVKSLARMAPLYPPIDFEKAVAWCEKRTRKMLAPSHDGQQAGNRTART